MVLHTFGRDLKWNPHIHCLIFEGGYSYDGVFVTFHYNRHEDEMALHPRIQKNLLDYLNEKATEKGLTIIISTHSITMIKSTHRNNIMLMENDASENTVISTPCYPAKAIGYVDFESNIIFDTIFFVEDDMARLVLKAMIAKYANINTLIKSMMYCIVPVGGDRKSVV